MILTALKKGLGLAGRYRRVLLIMYVFTFALAALATLPLQALFEAKAGQSLMLEDLLLGFDLTFLNDFLQNYGEGFIPIVNQSLWLIVVHFICMVFLMSGAVKLLVAQPDRFDKALYWTANATYFWRMLRLTLSFAVIHLAVLALFAFLFVSITQGMSPAKLESELIFMDTLNVLLPVYVFVAAFFLMWQDYAKLFMVKDGSFWMSKHLFKSIKFIVKNAASTYILFLFNLLLLAALIAGNYYLSVIAMEESSAQLLYSFLLSQAFILLRLFLKFTRLGSAAAWLVERT